MPTSYESPWNTEDVRTFRQAVQDFVRREFVPRLPKWRAQHRPDPEDFELAGAVGMLLPDIGAEYGGSGGTFAHEAVVVEELARAGVHFGANVQSITAHYILKYGTDEQKRRWLPKMASGELIGAIAMTEPSAGSDLQGIKMVARKDGDHYVIDGSKTFITNGHNAGLVCLAVKTDPKLSGPKAISLLCVETAGLGGYRVGKPLEKIGRHEVDTCELFFENVRVPVSCLLGGEGKGFFQMMDQLVYERLSVGVEAVATMETALTLTTQYVKDRKVSGQTLIDFQNTRMVLAQCKTEAQIGRVFLDNCIERFLGGGLDAVTAAMAKWWLSDREGHVVDECVQLHGGYGYMSEYAIAQIWADARVRRIYAGTNEVMKEMIAWSL